MNEAVQRLIDKDQILDLMAIYARAVDRGDWEALRRVYHHDAYDDHGDYKGDLDGFIAFARDRTGGATQVMHFLGQSLIEFAGADLAVAETYFVTAHTLGPAAQRQYGAAADGGPVQISQYGRYVDRVERREGVWKIAHRIVIFEATRLALEKVPPLKAEWARLQRDQSDPIFQVRKSVGL